jgi:hypothetical protein
MSTNEGGFGYYHFMRQLPAVLAKNSTMRRHRASSLPPPCRVLASGSGHGADPAAADSHHGCRLRGSGEADSPRVVEVDGRADGGEKSAGCGVSGKIGRLRNRAG